MAYSPILNSTMALVDQFERKADYLRIAVTDRCNLRCRYCMPAHGIDFVNRKELLSYDEIVRLANIFKDSGVNKVRVTGGDPFVRRDMDVLIQSLCEIFQSVHITTNASLIHEHMPLLKHPHIQSLNISLDSLCAKTFANITRRDEFEMVHRNILKALNEGITVKLNMVVMKGVNDHEIPAFVNFGRTHGTEVRFIEAMPFNEYDGNKDLFLSHDAILKRITSAFTTVEPRVDSLNSSSLKYEVDGLTRIGIIPAYTRSLCGTCNRIRLTSKGDMLTCLYAKVGVNLRDKMRLENLSDEALKEIIHAAVWKKRKSGLEEEELRHETVFQSMTSIGG